MAIYIKDMTWEQFSNCCGEGADYLLGTGQAEEIGDLESFIKHFEDSKEDEGSDSFIEHFCD